jgi:hypothetical protein
MTDSMLTVAIAQGSSDTPIEITQTKTNDQAVRVMLPTERLLMARLV